MKFLWQDTEKKKISNDLTVHEYCHREKNLPLDGAIAKLNGSFGPKTNTHFTELFLVLSGTLIIEEEDLRSTLSEKDIYIMQPGKKHKLIGDNCTLFISCSPQFDPSQVIFNDKRHTCS